MKRKNRKIWLTPSIRLLRLYFDYRKEKIREGELPGTLEEYHEELKRKYNFLKK